MGPDALLEARRREGLAHEKEIVRSDFEGPDAEAEMEDTWKGMAALSKEMLSVEIDELPIVRADSGVLSDLPENSKLYINGHGEDGVSYFQYEREEGPPKKLPMEVMARWFVQAGLPRNRHYDIRLRMCHGACPGPDGPSMAEQFRNVMQEFGYGNVDVSGYLGALVPMPLLHDDGVRHTVMEDDHGDGAFSRRSENRITYKADGSVVDSRVAKAARNDESDE